MRTTTAAATFAVVLGLTTGMAGCSTTTVGHAAYAPISCSGQHVVEPRGAPYCYQAPDGFTIGAKGRLGESKYPSAIGLDPDNIIAAGIFHAPADTDDLSDGQLRQANDQVVVQAESGTLDLDSRQGTLTKVPAGRVIGYEGRTRTGKKLGIALYFVFDGHSKLQVNCQWTTKEDRIRAGCTKVLHDLRLASVN